MITYLPTIFLAFIQGLTEFLPISSSGHLVLIHEFVDTALSDINQKRMDVAVHIGTLFAVFIYFRGDLWDLICGGIDLIRFKKTVKRHKTLMIAISSVPVIILGFVVFMIDMTLFDSVHIMAWATIIFGVILYVADRRVQTSTSIEEFNVKNALVYGVAQCFALIPGVSRSGVTMTAGRFMGHSRVAAARYSLLMGMITISAAGFLGACSAINDTDISMNFINLIAIGMVVSFITAYATIYFMMRWFSGQGTMTPFVIYRLLLGIILLVGIYSGHIHG